MCGRYFIERDDPDAQLAAYFAEAETRADRMGLTLALSGEIRPSDVVPVIATGAAHRTIGAFPMQWGFPHPSRALTVINTRSETAAQKPLFAPSIQNRRCLIPASGYYEWQKAENGGKLRYAFRARDGAPLYLAGLYLRAPQFRLPRFSILTREAADGIRSIHGRMPVLLPKEAIPGWLSPECSYETLLKSAVLDVAFCAE